MCEQRANYLRSFDLTCVCLLLRKRSTNDERGGK